VTEKGEANLPVRTKFMIETINNLKNNRMKTGLVASAMTSEHTIRMKKTLGTMSQRNTKASEPLGIGLDDIRKADKGGKWWLVGASWKNDTLSNTSTKLLQGTAEEVQEDTEYADTNTPSLLQLAKEQRMNTDIRRAIFVNIMSATDYKDASMRLRRLKLKKSQELEVPRVLLHCAGAEQGYNPFYTLIAKKLCSEHRLRMAFQFGLWGLFRRLGEKDDLAQDDDYGEEEEELDLRKIVNLARIYADLISAGSLHITVLKVGDHIRRYAVTLMLMAS
jgi:nucleolar MIF4G domain-containing protein 1